MSFGLCPLALGHKWSSLSLKLVHNTSSRLFIKLHWILALSGNKKYFNWLNVNKWAWALKPTSFSFKSGLKAFICIQNNFRHNIELPLKLSTFDPLLGVKSAGHQMGCFRHQNQSNPKLTNQWTELKTGLKQLKEQLSKRDKLNRQALGLLGVGLGSKCRKSAKKWPGDFSMKIQNHSHKPGLLPQAYGDQIRAQEQKTRSKCEPRSSLEPNVRYSK